MSELTFSSELISKLSDWEYGQNPTPDEIIHAFSTGVEKSKDAIELAIRETHIENISSAIKFSEIAFKKLESIGMDCFQVFIKASVYSQYNVIIVVSNESFLTAARRESYSVLRDLSKENSSPKFNLTFSLLPSASKIENRQSLSSDGYVIRYEPK